MGETSLGKMSIGELWCIMIMYLMKVFTLSGDLSGHYAGGNDVGGNDDDTHIIITHTHRDHSPGARLLKAETGALVWGCGPGRGNNRG